MATIVTLPHADLDIAIEDSFKRQRVINEDLLVLLDSVKKVDDAIRDPIVPTSTRAARTLRPIMNSINKIMTDFDIYEVMCQDVYKIACENRDQTAAEREKNKNEDGNSVGDDNTSMAIDEPVTALDSPQMDGGADANEDIATAETNPASDKSTAQDATTQEITTPTNDEIMRSPTPRLGIRTFHIDTAATLQAKNQLFALNESYIFLIGNLLHKLKTLDKAMGDTLIKGTASVRAEFIRIRWDKVVGEFRATFARVWAGCGGGAALGG